MTNYYYYTCGYYLQHKSNKKPFMFGKKLFYYSKYLWELNHVYKKFMYKFNYLVIKYENLIERNTKIKIQCHYEVTNHLQAVSSFKLLNPID